MCWTICKASIFDWIKKNPNNPTQNYHHQKTLIQHLPPSAPPVSYFHVIMMKGAEAEVKEYCDMLSSYPFYSCKASCVFFLIFCYLFLFILLTFPVLALLPASLHTISEFSTDVSARGALPFPLGYRFYFNKLYWWFPWQKSETAWKRMCSFQGCFYVGINFGTGLLFHFFFFSSL